MSWSAGQLAAWCGAQLRGDPERRVEGVSTDSRSLRRGDLFVAIPGEHFDGHSYVSQAIERGAAAVLVARLEAAAADVPTLHVSDTLAALAALACGHRARFGGPLVAITGSNGKTTTKEMCAGILEAAALCVHRSRGNLNNHIGLPLSLLSLPTQADVAVVELGMNHAGEIAALAQIARPTVGAITQVSAAHLGPLGSLEAIARAKGELFEHLQPEGVAVVNLDDANVRAQAERFSGRKLGFGRTPEADVRAERVCLERSETRFHLVTPEGATDVVLAHPGAHLVEDALCAAAAAIATDRLQTRGGSTLDALRTGLERFAGVAGRLTLRETADGVLLVDDSYNANPASVAAALSTLRELCTGGRAIAVLGDMLELGDAEAALHADVGRDAAAAGVDLLIAVGERSRHAASEARRRGLTRVHEVDDAEDAATLLRGLLEPGDVVLVKGSRGMRMERAVEALLQGKG